MNSATRAFFVTVLLSLLMPGLVLSFSNGPASAYSVPSTSPSLAIYPPPSIAADDRLYPFLIQAQSSQGTPLDVNVTVYLSSSSSVLLRPTAPQLNLVDGQGVFYANASEMGAVKMYAGAQGFLPTSVDLEIVDPAVSSPLTLRIVAPTTAVEGEQVPVIVASEGGDGSPVATSLSFKLSSSLLGGDVSTAPSLISGSFQGGAYSIQYLDLPSNGTWALSVSGDHFSPGNESYVNVISASQFPNAGSEIDSLQASYMPTMSLGTVWPVVISPTVNGVPTNISTVRHLVCPSSNPKVASVSSSAAIASQYYELFYLEASKVGTSQITFQAQGYLPLTFTVNCVAAQEPFAIRAYGPTSSYANPVQLLELVSAPASTSNVSLPMDLGQVDATLTSSYSGLAKQNVLFVDGFAGLNLSSSMSGPSTFLAQGNGMYAANFSASLIHTPFTVTVESNAPGANFTVGTAQNKTNLQTNSSALLSEPAVVTAPSFVIANNGTTQYEFSNWKGNPGNATTEYVQKTSTIFAYYTKTSFLTTVGTNLPSSTVAANLSVSYESGGAMITNRTEEGTVTLIAPQGLTVSAPATVLGSQQGVLAVFTGWSDGVNASTRFVQAGSNVTADFLTEYLVSASTSYGQVINGSGYFKAGSLAELKLDKTSVPTGFLVYKVFSGWRNANGSVTKASNPYFMSVISPTHFTAIWEVDYSKLILFIAVLVMLAAGGLYGFAAWRKRMKGG